MSSPSQLADISNGPTVLRPYQGSSRLGLRRTLKRVLWPVMILTCLFYGMIFTWLPPFLIVLIVFPVIILAFVSIWALPDARTAPTAALVFLLFAFFIALILWPNYIALTLPGLPWITMLRLTGIPLAITLLLCVSISKDFRTRTATALRAAPYISRLLIAFVAVQVVTVALSSSPFESFQKVVLWQISWTAIFFTSCYVFLKPGRVERWGAILCLMTVPIGLIAIKEHAVNHLPWVGHIPSFLRIEESVVSKVLSGSSRDIGGPYRVQSTFSTPLGLAEYVALTVPFLYHYAAGKYPVLIRLAAIAAVPVLLTVVLWTDSRLGLLGIFVATLLYILGYGVLRWRRSPHSPIGPAIVLAYPVLFSAAIAATFFVGRIRNKVWGGGQYDASTSGRGVQYAMGMPMVLHRFWGHGGGMGGGTLGFTNPEGDLTIDTYYLLIALDYGILGFIFYFGTIIAAIYYATKYTLHLKDPSNKEFTFLIPIALSLINFFIIKAVFSNDDNHPLVYMMMGMVVALIYRIRSAEPGPDKAPAVSLPARRARRAG